MNKPLKCRMFFEATNHLGNKDARWVADEIYLDDKGVPKGIAVRYTTINKSIGNYQTYSRNYSFVTENV